MSKRAGGATTAVRRGSAPERVVAAVTAQPRPCVLALAGVLCTLLASGCLSITRGRQETIDVQTTPPGAQVTIRPAPGAYATPAHVSLPRKPHTTVNASEAGAGTGAAYVVTASMPGYRDASVPIQSRFSGETWVDNLIWIHPLFLLLGVAVDTGSGAAYELSPSNITLVLEPEAIGVPR
jgi:hypothetical protein